MLVPEPRGVSGHDSEYVPVERDFVPRLKRPAAAGVMRPATISPIIEPESNENRAGIEGVAHMLSLGLWFFGLVGLIVLMAFLGAFFTIETAHAGVVQRLGKFQRIAPPGLNFKVPFIDTVVRRLTLQVQQLDVKVETKTKDNVFVQIPSPCSSRSIRSGCSMRSTSSPTRSSRSSRSSTT